VGGSDLVTDLELVEPLDLGPDRECVLVTILRAQRDGPGCRIDSLDRDDGCRLVLLGDCLTALGLGGCNHRQHGEQACERKCCQHGGSLLISDDAGQASYQRAASQTCRALSRSLENVGPNVKTSNTKRQLYRVFAFCVSRFALRMPF